jgi:hypothetical protein
VTVLEHAREQVVTIREHVCRHLHLLTDAALDGESAAIDLGPDGIHDHPSHREAVVVAGARPVVRAL